MNYLYFEIIKEGSYVLGRYSSICNEKVVYGYNVISDIAMSEVIHDQEYLAKDFLGYSHDRLRDS